MGRAEEGLVARAGNGACRCVLVAASVFDRCHFLERYKQGVFAFVLAVDGGYANLQSCGVEPDAVIGDFDSLGFVPRACPAYRFPAEKDESDLELAFTWAIERGFRDFVVYGALGGRLDHTLASLQVCAQICERKEDSGPCSVMLVGDCVEGYLLHGPCVMDFPVCSDGVDDTLASCGSRRFRPADSPGPFRGTVSVFSLCDKAHGVFEEGLRYPLPKTVLTNRTSLCLSNEFTGRSARIGVEEGTILIICSNDSGRR